MTAKKVNDGPEDPELIRFLREELGESLPAGGQWTFTGPLWIWRGKAKDGAKDGTKDGTPTSTAWHFITITGAVADGIRGAAPGRSAAWGSVYVSVTIGKTSWQTSVFPSKDVGGYLLPVKASVRKAEKLTEGDEVTVELSI
jgi:hypothetical protein